MLTKHNRGIWRTWNAFKSQMSVMVFFIVYSVAAIILIPKFGNPENLSNILVQSTDLIILSCGLTFIFLNGGIDFSLTAVMALSSVIGAKVMTSVDGVYSGIILGILSMVLVALVVGTINGLSVAWLKMPSFIATMGTQLVFSGIALTMTQSNTIGGLHSEFNNIAQGKFLNIHIPVYIAIIIVGFFIYLLNFTLYGKQIVAIGTNHKTSIISGLPVKRRIFSLFIISALCAAIASVIMTARLGAGLPSLGKDMLLDVVAAIIIGGTSNAGGFGTIVGSVIGAIIVVMLNNSLNLLGVDWYYITACKGAVILAISLISILQRRSK
jgi:ribose/xylose/arabinose/galactoside ABC-type transport system permease subunit